MEINANNYASNSSTGQASPVQSNGGERDLFMSLLVAQLKNQDPLSPQDGTAFVAQLAQFNSLDQLIGIRESLERLTLMSQNQALSAKEVSEKL